MEGVCMQNWSAHAQTRSKNPSEPPPIPIYLHRRNDLFYPAGRCEAPREPGFSTTTRIRNSSTWALSEQRSLKHIVLARGSKLGQIARLRAAVKIRLRDGAHGGFPSRRAM